MKRREFIAIAGGAAAWPLTAGAQQSREMRRIAVLMGTATTDLGKSYLATFLQRLEQLGWANGRNARVETRWWIGTVDEMRPGCWGAHRVLARRDHGVQQSRSCITQVHGEHDTGRICWGRRSNWRWVRLEPRSSGRQHHRFRRIRWPDRGQA
jgi:hypothetical protein